MKLAIFTDGGARGNPGPAGIGVVINKIDGSNKEEMETIAKFIGEKTNNQAEYSAVIEALSWVKNNITPDAEINCFLDSQLVVEQLNQRYKLKNGGLKPLFWQIRELIISLGGNVTFEHIPRERNSQADKLVNMAIDEALKRGENVI